MTQRSHMESAALAGGGGGREGRTVAGAGAGGGVRLRGDLGGLPREEEGQGEKEGWDWEKGAVIG